MFQIISQDQSFTSPDLDMAKLGFDYSVIAVFGSQSTGKSTLLNLLFGTKFNTMDESIRQQTTKGIWLSKQNNLVILDVEGTDGRERGDNQVA
jgi:GTPase Era involved in 16S rRNA processing